MYPVGTAASATKRVYRQPGSPPVFSAQSAPNGSVGVAYSYTFVASGGATFSLGSGTIPGGLSLSSGGVLSGTPNTGAGYTFTVLATNANGSTSSTSQSVTVGAGEPTGILWTTYTTAMWDEAEAWLATIGNPYYLGGLGAASYRQRIADIEATTSGGTLLNPGDNIASAVAAVGAGGLVRLNGGPAGAIGDYTLTADVALDGKRLVTAPGAKVRINCGSTDNAFNMRGTAGVLAGIGAGSYIKLINGGNLGIAMFDLTDGSGVPLGNCKNNTLYRLWVDDMGNSAHDTVTGTSISMFYGSANGLAVNIQTSNGTDDYTGGNCDGVNMANNSVAGSGPAAGRLTSNALLGGYVDRISDDGIDFWNSNVPQYVFHTTSTRAGLHPTHPSGDGNGIKTGVGNAQHEIFKSKLIGNKDFGANNNGNTLKSRYKTCDFTSVPNLAGDLAGGPTLYTVIA